MPSWRYDSQILSTLSTPNTSLNLVVSLCFKLSQKLATQELRLIADAWLLMCGWGGCWSAGISVSEDADASLIGDQWVLGHEQQAESSGL